MFTAPGAEMSKIKVAADPAPPKGLLPHSRWNLLAVKLQGGKNKKALRGAFNNDINHEKLPMVLLPNTTMIVIRIQHMNFIGTLLMANCQRNGSQKT